MVLYSISKKVFQSLNPQSSKSLLLYIKDYHNNHYNNSEVNIEIPIGKISSSNSMSFMNHILRVITALYISFLCVVPLNIGMDLNIYFKDYSAYSFQASKLFVNLENPKNFFIETENNEIADKDDFSQNTRKETKYLFTDLDFNGINHLPEVSDTAIGGSFDHMHLMHKVLLSTASLISQEKVSVGVTSSEMILSKKYSMLSQSFLTRKNKVFDFLSKFSNPNRTINVFEINDNYGPWWSSWDSLVLSEETIAGGEKINQLRRETSLPELSIVSLSVLELSTIKSFLGKECKRHVSDFEGKLSSTQIRKIIIEKARVDPSQILWVKSLYRKALDVLNAKYDQSQFDAFFDTVLKKYSESQRHYHTIKHIIDCLTKLHEYFLEMIESQRDLAVITIALVYHDVIYDVHKEDNEVKSAELAESHLTTLGVLKKEIDDVYALIIATIAHEHDKPPQSQGTYSFLRDVLIDIDMSILSSERDLYVLYAQEVALEYAFLGKTVYRKRRKEVLSGILDNKHVYRFVEIFSVEMLQSNIQFEIENMLG